ncbi:MAG TPA: ergothioneine biosynthesis protein EgtB [Longimicrobiales bacterium]
MTAQTMTTRTDRRDLADLLAAVRARTMLLIAPVSEDDLRAQHDPIMGPILWDLGHIASFEELWLLHNLTDGIGAGEMPGLYDPFENPRAVRGRLELPSLADCLARMEAVRREVLERLAVVDLDGDDPLLRDGFVYRMVAQHEWQHLETVLQTLQLKRGAPYPAPRAYALPVGPRPAEPGAMVRFPGGTVELGTDDRSLAYDNERPRHTVRLAPFWIDVAPVTNGEYLEFMEAGGYARREFWSDAGWRWLEETGVCAPKYWTADGRGGWRVRSMDRSAPPDPDRPVCHVCYYEAEAFARYAGKRLPTEAEWEAAAAWDPERGTALRFPWGDDPPTPQDANLDQLAFETARIGAYPRNVSPIGCYGMIGDVWEWTSSDFRPYPGFEAFPYREYSEVFFGSEYKVLRGGSWATAPLVVRNTFRNWDYPIRRQIFSGFRCARDA